MSSGGVVALQPTGEGGRPLRRGAVDGRVGPLAQHRADESLRLAVGLGSARPGADVADAERPAGERMGDRDVGGSVVGHQPLHRDPVRAVEGHRPSQEADRGGRLLVGQDLGVGEAGGVVDADVDPLPADLATPAARRVDGGAVAPAPPGHAVPGPVRADAAEFLHVDVDQLARPGALVATDRLRRLQAREPAEADPQEHRRDGRGRHPEELGDLGTGHPHAPEGGDRLDPSGRGHVCDPPGRGAAVEQPRLALGAVAAHPFAGRPHAHSGGLGRLREREALLGHEQDHPPPALRAERRITVELHPDPPCSWGFDTASLQGGPDEQRA